MIELQYVLLTICLKKEEEENLFSPILLVGKHIYVSVRVCI